uniref:NADH dehydrogenase subunit 6 n=1 Tax=Stenothyra glabra TaxID=1345646 RepID=UPI0026E45E37|nr:NADH dehydrogenase subunit 6 [Stenothyra glabra]USN91683.1 NADH dehydrogenase subunit 6 [Stenothyra glabra]
MASITLMALSVCSVIMFPLMAQPLSLGLSIMIATLFLCMSSAMMLSSWYAYILFLIYVGGLLVMFAYVAALSPNMLFSSMSAGLFFCLLVVPVMVIIYNYNFVDSSKLEFLNSWLEIKKFKIYGVELASPYYISILVSLGLILLINLVVVVKICYYQHASLRPFKQQ